MDRRPRGRRRSPPRGPSPPRTGPLGNRHPPPTVPGPADRVRLNDLPAGPPLGVGVLPFETAGLELHEGSPLALYSDGLPLADRRDIDQGLTLLRTVPAGPARSLRIRCRVARRARPQSECGLRRRRTRLSRLSRAGARCRPVRAAVAH
ncbi:SpoIIE family protein phosphatase [Streptomyces sp. NPDC006602]|uniref:SpoIIE family protein phosphatase n=1 Tax=Streptomyces sp. NPDC006602 TaxID=3364751 RepID=UPI0036CA8005